MELGLGLTIGLLVILLLLLLLSGMPIAFALFAAGIIGIYFIVPLGVAGDAARYAWNMLNNSTLTSITLYVFMGELIVKGKVSENVFKSLDVWLGRIPGGQLHSTIGFCGMFAAVSGSSVATAATIGTMALPEMKQRNYDPSMIYGAVAGGGTLGILIPPSNNMIIYGWLTNVSIAKCFFAGLIPGIVLVLIYMGYVIIRVKASPSLAPGADKVSSWKQKLLALPGLGPLVLLAVIILGGIYLGIYTPTEAAAVGCLAAFVMVIVKRTMSWLLLFEALKGTLYTSCMIFMIVAGAGLTSYMIEYLRIPALLMEWIGSLGLSPYVVLAFVVFVYYVLGCLIEGIAMCLLTIPVIQPVMVGLGFDPFWFAVILVICVEVGLLTPPVGINLYVIKGIDPKAKFEEIIWGSMPYVGLMTLMIIILAVFPQLATWLPSMMD